MKPTVVILNDYQTAYGGASSVAINSAIGLTNHGYHVILFSAVRSSDTSFEQIPNLEVINLSGQDILNDSNRIHAAANGLWNFKARFEFDRLLSRLDPKNTIIHLHSWTKSLSSSPVSAGIKRSFKILTTFHDYFLVCPNGAFFNFPKEQHCHLRPLSRECLLENCDMRNYPQKLWRVARQFIQHKAGGIPGKLRYFTYPSNFSLNILKPFLPVGSSFYPLENPINVSKKERIQSSKNEELVYIGRLSREKGAVIFANATRITDSPSVFYGVGPELEAVKAANPNAILKGWFTHEELINNLQTSRCLVFPSICYEVSPLAILEAAALGVPAIVPDDTAAVSLIIPNETGIIFTRGCVESLVEKIKLIKDDKFVEYLSQNTYRNYWKNEKDLNQYVWNLSNIYEDILFHSDSKS